jgi:Leucine-rich repeat (LRR) protein
VNRITAIPDEISRLTRLTVLDLRSNALTAVSRHVLLLPALQVRTATR